MNEKLLPTTAGALDKNELQKLRNSIYGTFGIPASVINSNSVYGMYGTYGTHSAADVRPTYVHDKWMKPREMQLQQKRVTMRYAQFFKPEPFDIYKDVYSANELSSYISSSIENLRKTLKEAFGELFDLEENNMSRKSLEVKKVIYSGPCTIVIWADDSKTIVRCQDGDTYSKEVGLLMCLAKKVWGTNTSGSNFNDYISKVISEKEDKK